MTVLAQTPVDLSIARRGAETPVDLSTVSFAELERRRRALNIPRSRWIAAAGMDPRTFRRAREGLGYQRTDKLGRLARALDALAGLGVSSMPKDRIEATIIRGAIAGAELALDVEFARSRRLAKACAGRFNSVPPARKRRFAVYLVAVEMQIGNADIARALGCRRQNIKQARDEIDALRDHRLVDAMLDRIAAAIGGR